MSETTVNDTVSSNGTPDKTSHPPLTRASTMPTTPTSPLAENPWYRQKFELHRDIIEEKVRDEYPDLPETHKIQPTNIEHSTMKGYDLDFPIELHDGQSTIISVSYGSGRPPAYTKEERRKLVSIRQNTTSDQ